ncbi:MAG: hypothetical protein KF727_00125 [Microbacteriaceae bacterium]|nr:hypothetical protein [Microbacteriaceae bacterium]
MTTTPIPTGPAGTPAAGPNKLLIALIAVGGVLLLAIVALVFLLIGQNTGGGTIGAGDQSPTPVVTETPATPAPEPTGEATDDSGTDGGTGGSTGGGQAPVDNSVRFTSFSANLNVQCDPTGQAEEKAQPKISWSSANAVKVYWTPSNKEANSENGYQVPLSGNQNDMSASKGPGERYEFPCNHRQTFDTTITLVGANGQKVSKTVTFTDVNWGTGGGDDED